MYYYDTKRYFDFVINYNTFKIGVILKNILITTSNVFVFFLIEYKIKTYLLHYTKRSLTFFMKKL